MMKYRLPNPAVLTIGALILLGCPAWARAADAAPLGARQTLSFDEDWRFHLGEVDGGQTPAVADTDWRGLDVPHDFSIEGPPGTDPATIDGPFDRKSPGGTSAGALNGGIGWYRKNFTLPEDTQGKCVGIQFDGVYMDSEVWLNGVSVGKQAYGYSSFQVDLTKNLKPGKNLLAVRVNVQQPCSRWYSGAGIFRHVWLVLTDQVHVAPWGTYVTTPEVTDATAQVSVRTQVRNDGAEAVKATVTTEIFAPGGAKVAEQKTDETVAAGGSHEYGQSLKVEAPRRWSTEDPSIYQVVSAVSVGGRVVDRYTTPLGIRTIQFTADNGFLLNGKRVQLKGVCLHHDLGCLGSAVHRRGIERQLEILKAMGCNAIRTSHNPPAPELLALCDRMGMLVMDEIFDEWIIPKSGMKFGYKRFFDEWSERDLVGMLRRDRNHPCVILWSIGNEIKEQAAPQGGAMAQRLADICHREDPTRMVTSGVNKMGQAIANGFTKALDVVGMNYFTGQYNEQKGKLLVASETSSALSTRGEYGLQLKSDGKLNINMRPNNECVSYDLDRPGWGCTAEESLLFIKRAPWVAGEFVWTGFDYIGEPTPYGWPSRSSYFGIIDLAGFPKDRYYLYQARWRPQLPMAHILPHWNWPERVGQVTPVMVYTSGDEAELFLNGRSLGRRARGPLAYRLRWDGVRYEPGELRVVAYRQGKKWAESTVRTTGPAARVLLAADRAALRADGTDLAFVTVTVADREGRAVPRSRNPIRFSVTGPAEIAGVDNGDATSFESFRASERSAYNGLALAILRTRKGQAGAITLKAESEGLAPAEVALQSVAP